MTDATWVLDGTTFYGYDAGVDKLIVRTLTGVNDPPPVRTEEIPKAISDGDHDNPTTRGARLIPAAGWCRASNEAALLALRNEFANLLSGGASGTFTINEFAIVRTCTVQVYGTPKFDTDADTLSAEWSIMLRATDPLLYVDGVGSY
jgi:hypothetical protein